MGDGIVAKVERAKIGKSPERSFANVWYGGVGDCKVGEVVQFSDSRAKNKIVLAFMWTNDKTTRVRRKDVNWKMLFKVSFTRNLMTNDRL